MGTGLEASRLMSPLRLPSLVDELLIPEFAVIYGSMWFLFALLVGRALWLQWNARK